jgi:hypothetical protein
VVVAVSVACPADPAVLSLIGVQVPEGVGEVMFSDEGTVEVVFERGEEGVVRLVAGFGLAQP